MTMTHVTNNPARPDAGAVPPARSGGVVAFFLGAGAVLYVLLAAGCAAYLLWNAYKLEPVDRLSDFNKLAIGALIAVVGTGLTGLAAVYSATRQSATAFQVAEYNGLISANLAAIKQSADAELTQIKGAMDKAIAELKTNSDEALARLKVALDAGQIANKELLGTASTYFYALRSFAIGLLNEDLLKTSEASMVTAARHVINVDEPLRDQWFDFWQRAQNVYLAATNEPNVNARPDLVRKLIEEKINFGSERLNLRDLHSRVEKMARLALETP